MGKPLAGLGVTLGLERNPVSGYSRTDFHGALHIFHRGFDGYFVLFAHFVGESLEPRSGEPGWEILYCPRFR